MERTFLRVSVPRADNLQVWGGPDAPPRPLSRRQPEWQPPGRGAAWVGTGREPHFAEWPVLQRPRGFVHGDRRVLRQPSSTQQRCAHHSSPRLSFPSAGGRGAVCSLPSPMASEQTGSRPLLLLRLLWSVCKCCVPAALPAEAPASAKRQEEAAAPESAGGSQPRGLLAQAGHCVRERRPSRPSVPSMEWLRNIRFAGSGNSTGA